MQLGLCQPEPPLKDGSRFNLFQNPRCVSLEVGVGVEQMLRGTSNVNYGESLKPPNFVLNFY